MHVNTQIATARRTAYALERTATSKSGAIQSLRDDGWRQIGKGAFSIAFTHDHFPLVVIKVSAQPGPRSKGIMGDGFPEYANAIQRDWIRSSLAPRIYFSERLRKNWNVTITAMERCYPCKNADFIHKAERTATNLNSSQRCYGDYTLHGHARRFLENARQYGSLDIHRGNVMQRRNGSLVFTDPLTIDRM